MESVMKEFTIETEKVSVETKEIEGAKIVVIGVGGAGGNMLSELANTDLKGKVKTIAANTDMQALEGCEADIKVQLGPAATGGKGAGMDPEVGKIAALESYEEIKKAIGS